MNAYLVSHNGLGDNLFMIGAIRFLTKYYDKVYFLCKNKYHSNVELFFKDNENIVCLPFNEYNENNDYDEKNQLRNIIQEKYSNNDNDIFICGCHKTYLQSKIRNKLFLECIILNKNYNIDFDTITTDNYNFIENFYKDIRLNLTVFYDYFTLPEFVESMELYKSVEKYNIIFVQIKSSCGKTLNVNNLLNKYLNDEKTILICNDFNLYDSNSNSKDIKMKFKLCENFVFCKIVYLIDTIKNSNEIYIIDSCLIGLVLPFLKQNLLKAEIVRIIRRELVKNNII